MELSRKQVFDFINIKRLRVACYEKVIEINKHSHKLVFSELSEERIVSFRLQEAKCFKRTL